MKRKDGAPVQQSLFEFVQSDQFNETEKDIALYLDEQQKLYFWYRNRSRADYGIQAWQHDKIYPDFIFTVTEEEKKDEVEKVYIVETKGAHLAGNPDTCYKETVFALCGKLAREANHAELPLGFKKKPLEYKVIYGTEWQQRLNELFLTEKKLVL